MLRWLRGLFGRDGSAVRSSAEFPWNLLAETGNGIGLAPASLRAIPVQDDDAFQELYCGELVDCFWHQGTIYAATPFAVDEVLHVIDNANAAKQETLLHWIHLCLQSERLGPVRPSHAGVWMPRRDQGRLKAAGVQPQTVGAVIRRHLTTLNSLASEATPPAVRATAAKLLSAVDEPQIVTGQQ